MLTVTAETALAQSNRNAFRSEVNKLFIGNPLADPQVSHALSDLGWKQARGVFGYADHILERNAGASPFVLAPLRAAEQGSVSVKSETGGAFAIFLRECRKSSLINLNV